MKHFYAQLLFSLICVTGLHAQFGPAQIISLPTDPSNFQQYIRTADVDGDGKLDILVGSSFSEICRIFHNEGNLNFAPPVLLPATWLQLGDIETADLNSDAKPDVISLDLRAGKLFWHPNADGAFPQQILIAENLGTVTTRIVCEDFNGDNKKDIVILNHFNALLFLNDGDGNFSPPTNIIPLEDETEFYDHVSDDFNGDGVMDLAITSDGFKVYINDGTGHFTEAQGGGTAISFLIESADYNNDGLDDIIMDGLPLVPYLNSTTGFSVGSSFSPNNENYKTIFSSDLDNDGDLDVLSEDDQTNSFFWYENVNNASSWIRHTISTGFNGSTIFGVRAADLDGDNDNDLIRSSSNGDVAIYENQINLKVDAVSNVNFNFYPNPAFDKIYISNSEDIVAIEIYDLLAKKVLQQTVNGKSCAIDIATISAGSYFLKVTTNNGTSVKQFLIAR